MLFTVAIVMLSRAAGMFTQDAGDKQTLFCGIGELKNITGETPVCQPCPTDSYMDVSRHIYLACKPCTQYSLGIDHVTATEECTRGRNTFIKECAVGFFISKNDNHYECKPCRMDDCGERPDCCKISATTTTSSSTTATFNVQTTASSKSSVPDSRPINSTHCDDAVSKTENCLSHTYVNKSCFHYRELVKELVLCQHCPWIIQHNVHVCSSTQGDGSHQSLSPGAVAGIAVAAVVAFLGIIAAVTAFIYYQRNGSRKYRTYTMAGTAPTGVNKDSHEPIGTDSNLTQSNTADIDV